MDLLFEIQKHNMQFTKIQINNYLQAPLLFY